MVRVKRGVVSGLKHKKILRQSKGFYGARSRSYRVASQSVIKSLQYSYRDRKRKKRIFRRLWITRINAAARQRGIRYSILMMHLKRSSIDLNRKILSEIAILDNLAFSKLIDAVLSKNYLKLVEN